jgi:hypothetical protein
MDSDTGHTETKRDRVRRILLDPLRDNGFRFKRGVSEEEACSRLNAIADDLAYMSDDGLKALRVSMRFKGEGASRTFWPSRASFIGFAEAFERSPLEEAPALLRWFASVEGPKALAGGIHVAQYLFWTRNKRPPMSPADRKAVEDHAAQIADRAMRVRDKLDRGVEPFADDTHWYVRFLETEARVRGYIEAAVKGGDA